ncbi:MAG TPA: hypothetical protein DCL35_08745 [Candidatus Omnitrophica bacterium]|nr:hypothetical protein [Candidatus Omnitrophota bacterium]
MPRIHIKAWQSIAVMILLAAVVCLKALFLPKACFGPKCLIIELAHTEQQRQKGLMFRPSLPEDRGMLFIFPRDDIWGFWMKNTLISLDIIWIDKNRRVVDMVEGAMPFTGENPPTFRPVLRSRYVLEANSGFVKTNGIKIGDKARFRWIFLPKELK